MSENKKQHKLQDIDKTKRKTWRDKKWRQNVMILI